MLSKAQMQQATEKIVQEKLVDNRFHDKTTLILPGLGKTILKVSKILQIHKQNSSIIYSIFIRNVKISSNYCKTHYDLRPPAL